MKKCLLTLVCIVIVLIAATGQNISGIINTYTAVTTVGISSVTVVSTAGFTVGGKVLIIEMQGASIIQTNTSNFGDITSYGNAGNYEFDTISAIAGNVISFNNNLTQTFDTAGNVQLISVPIFTSAVVSGTLTCQPWNGTTGGVLVFQSTCTLTLNANIDVSNLGFRGGNFESDGGNFSCTAADYYTSSLPAWGDGGQKGESISEYILNEDGSMGKQANGGGGGNPGNSGGGGGGSFGSGGTGGYEYSGCGVTTIYGYPGQALSNAGNKIFMGGGGGGGLADNGQAVTAGGNGGAIVYILAGTIIGNSFNIVDTGQSVTQYSSDESSGGGGAGGTVVLDIADYNTPLFINTTGGYGGSSFNHIFTTACHGPGGGAGGGLLWVSGTALSPNITYTSNGGKPGLVLNPASTCYNTSFGASAGSNGGVLFSLPAFTRVYKINLGDDTTLCFDKTINLHAGPEFLTYLWQNNSTDSTLLAATTGKYYVTVTDSIGCKESDSVNIKVENQIIFSLGKDTSLCIGATTLLQAPGNYVSYLWQDNSTDSSYKVTAAGNYTVTVTDSIGCKGSDSIIVKIYPKDSLNLGNNNSICSGKPVPLNAGRGFKLYLWQDGSTKQIDTAKTGGLYTVITTDSVGCYDTASTQVKIVIAPIVNLGRDTGLCMPFSKLLRAGAGFVSYSWVDSSTNDTTSNSTYLVTMPGKYSVTIIDTNNCRVSDSIIITNDCPEIFLPDAFAPGNGSNNAYFRAFGEHITSYDMRIFSRWGELVFESTNIDYGWDGMYKGNPEPIGVYVYEIQYVGADRINHLAKGNITLLR